MANLVTVSTAELETELLRRRVLAGHAIELELRNRGQTDLLSVKLSQSRLLFSSRTCTAELLPGTSHFEMLKLMLDKASAEHDLSAERGS